ncbi:MAG: endo alpha-1,4 polygalactosaminidase [Coxiellaceae bacterium]|nr:endo alpha-1,4 polygalactosaminidase [Coxiellaceae bacterium]
MKLFKHLSAALIMIALSATSPIFAANLPSVAFYYGDTPPTDELHAFDVVVVDPNTGLNPKKFNDKNSQAYAYVSIGEWHADQKIPNKKWIMASNHTWNSYALDQSNPAWRAYALTKIIAPLVKQGYKGLFFDTMDSYHLFAKTSQARVKQEAGLVALIKSVKKRYPNIHIIVNRGFEILPKIHKDIDGVAVESLYKGWNQAKQSYVDVSRKDRTWIKAQMRIVKKYGLWPIVIDYVNPANSKKSQLVANKIKADKFIPWVANGALTNLGVGSVTVVPRTIDIVYDSKQFPDIVVSDPMRFIAFPLEQMGYIPKLLDVNKPLPSEPLKGRVAGIVVWLNGKNAKVEKRLDRWIDKQLAVHIPMTLLGNFMYLQHDKRLAQKMGMRFMSYEPTLPIKVIQQTSLIGYESNPYLPESDVEIHLQRGEPQLTIADHLNEKGVAVAYTPWGGYAQNPFIVQQISENQTYWILQPFAFLRQSLRLKHIPVADVTTKNGLRLLMVHIDGDGWASKSEWYKGPIAAQSMLDKVLQKYKVPTTVSVVEAEVSPQGVYPQFAKQSMQAARDIFKLPWVEIATHTYSHPYKWQLLAQHKVGKDYNLPIPGYVYSAKREITGSVDFINRRLAPKGKPCKVALWSGDTNPDTKALAVAYKDHLLNMNGGDTLITEHRKTLTSIAPIGVIKGEFIQIYAPNQNENVYTNDWTGPFYGFRKVIETYKLTESPHRYKPIDIYYHTYSASKKGSLRALYQVYNWALKQPTNKIYSSEYIQRAMAFYHVVYATSGNNWLVRNMGALKEYRVPNDWGYPVLSSHVMGYNNYDHQAYVHMNGGSTADIMFSKNPPTAPYIKTMNGNVSNFSHDSTSMHFVLHANEPIKLLIHGEGSCQLREGIKLIKPVAVNKGDYFYTFKQKSVAVLSEKCSAYKAA